MIQTFHLEELLTDGARGAENWTITQSHLATEQINVRILSLWIIYHIKIIHIVDAVPRID